MKEDGEPGQATEHLAESPDDPRQRGQGERQEGDEEGHPGRLDPVGCQESEAEDPRKEAKSLERGGIAYSPATIGGGSNAVIGGTASA